MHDDELRIDHKLVRDLVDTQFPEWSGLTLNRVPSSGTVHAIYRLGTAMAVRLPKRAGFTAALQRETEILPVLAPLLPLRIPKLVAVGSPTRDYPSMWSVLMWIDGQTMDTATLPDPVTAATRLGEFVVAMRNVEASGRVSNNQRAQPLAAHNEQARRSIAAVATEFDHERLTAIWESALAAPAGDGKRSWIHADLMPGNLVVSGGELSAVIDFGECALGNPTYDLIAGWWVFEGTARHAFRQATETDDASWHRAKGLALSGAVGALSYYALTNVAFAESARHTIQRILEDD